MSTHSAASVKTRLIVVVGTAVAVTFLGSLLATVAVLHRSLEQEAREELQNELENLLHNYELGGLKAVRQEIEVNSLMARDRPLFARLASESNQTLFSNVPREWSEFPFESLSERSPESLPEILSLENEGSDFSVHVVTARTEQGHVVQVGASTKVRGNVVSIVATTFAFVAIPSLAGIVLLIGIAVRHILRPIADVTDTVREVIQSGDYTRQVSTSHASRETNELVEVFNSLMSKVDLLVRHLRGTLESLAHEIRTPMTRLRAQMELAVSDETNAKELRNVLSDSLEESAHVISLLQQFLDASEAESGAVALNRESVRIDDLFSEVAEAYRFIGEEKSIEVQSRIQATDTVYLDPVRMRQAVSNLLDNAVKFSPRGSTVEISVLTRRDVIEIGVKDEGPGVPPEQRDRVWSYQYRGRTDGDEKGYGLGLTIVRAIAEAHGGSVELRQAPSGGAEFVIRVPYVAATTENT